MRLRWIVLGLLGSSAILGMWAAREPNIDLHFSRVVKTTLPERALANSINYVGSWPQWFFSLAEAQLVDASFRPLPGAMTSPQLGSLIQLKIDPKKGEWKRFTLLVQVVEYVPDRLIRLRVLKDSSGRMSRFFEQVQWKVEIKPGLVEGSATARTAYWKSRLFGRLTEKILMNQIFYPDLLKLAGLKTEQLANPMLPPSSQ